MKLSIIETRTVPTIKADFNEKIIIFHSKYDPLHEAKVWSQKELANINQTEDVVVIGIGAGYHIHTIAKMVPHLNIIVIEFNDFFYSWFLESPFYESIATNNNVTIKQFSRLSTAEREVIFSSVSSTNLLIHKNGLDILPKNYTGIRIALEDLKIKQNSIQNQIKYLKSNFKKNSILNDDSIGKLKNKYKNRPMILVSAGPSLHKQLPLLKLIRDEQHFVIGAVGTAIIPLLKFDIVPDFFTITDPNPATYSQLSGIDLPKTTLYYLSTAYHETVILHKGPRRIVYQEGYEEAEKLAMKYNDPIVKTGGSVATTLLDIMVYLGGKSIALIGQDLAFTNGKSHTSGAHAQKEINNIHGAPMTMDYYQTGKVQTANNLNLYRRWFERYAENHQNLQLFNCTEGGAYINNWEHITLYDFYKKYI